MSAFCTQCRSPNPDAASFCLACGSPLAVAPNTGRTLVNPGLSNPPLQQPLPAMPPIRTMLRPAQTTGSAQATLVRPTAVGGDQREHLVIVTDISGSMSSPYDSRRSKLDAAVRAGAALVVEKYRIDPLDEIAVVSFDEAGYLICPLYPLSTGKSTIIQALQSLQVKGGTDINEGLKTARDVFDWSRSGVTRRIALLTDGQGGHPLHTAQELKSRGVVIDVTGVGDSPSNVDEKLLKQVASVVDGELRYRFIKDQRTLVESYTRIAGKTMTS